MASKAPPPLLLKALPPLPTLAEVQERLQRIFPPEYPDRGILVGDMSARFVFVCLYGGFVEGTDDYVRPSTVIRFSEEQAALTADEQRREWADAAQRQGYEPKFRPWYADNSREPLRDDLIRNRLLPMGITVKRPGVPITSPAPIHALSSAFAALFDTRLAGEALDTAIAAWQAKHLDPTALARMRLLAAGVKASTGQVDVRLPTTGKTLRLPPGEASIITRDVCEQLAPRLFREPVVVHVATSEKKTHIDLSDEIKAVGIAIDTSAELPDVIIADIGDTHLLLAYVEVVHSDGPITELRAQALIALARAAKIPAERVDLVTAFEDRNAPAFRKRFSELAVGSSVWFRSEPDLLVRLLRYPRSKP